MVMNNVKFLILIVALFAAILSSAGCKKGGKVTSMSMSPDTAIMAHGTMLQLNAITTLDDGSVFNFTQVVEWTSSEDTIVHVSDIPGSKGIVTASTTTPGTVTITARDTVNHLITTATITVTDPVSIKIDPAFPHMAMNTRHQFHAIASFLSSTTLTQDIVFFAEWDSSDTLVATVQNTPRSIGNGIVTAGSVTSTTNITAAIATLSSGTISGSTQLTVTDYAIESIEVSAPTYSIPVGTTQSFSATGKYPANSPISTADFTSSVVWRSLNTAIAEINDTGLVTAKTITGTTIITATDPITNRSGQATLEVQ
jgi:hypothetical protein